MSLMRARFRSMSRASLFWLMPCGFMNSSARTSPGGIGLSFFPIGSSRSESRRLLQRLVHSRLPALASGLEALDHFARQPQRNRNLGRLFLRTTSAPARGEIGKNFCEWPRVLEVFLGPFRSVRIGRDAALNARFFLIGEHARPSAWLGALGHGDAQSPRRGWSGQARP